MYQPEDVIECPGEVRSGAIDIDVKLQFSSGFALDLATDSLLSFKWRLLGVFWFFCPFSTYFNEIQHFPSLSAEILWDTLKSSQFSQRSALRVAYHPEPEESQPQRPKGLIFFLIFFCAPNRQSIPRVDQRFSNSLDVTLDAPALKLRPALAGQSERHHRVAHDEDVGKEFDNQHFGDIFSNRVPVETWIQCSNPPYPPFMTRRSWWLSPLVLYWPTGLQTCPKLQRWPWDTMGYNEILIQSAAMKHNKDVAV